jgi:uracil-DNA glycosylase
LWGEFAKSYTKYIDKNNNLVLECRHPSGLAASKGPFVGNNHFKLTNEYLEVYGKEVIKWI